MAKDQRFYAKFTLDFPDNQKIKPLSDAAFRCLVEATIWSREHETDGFLARRLALASWSLEILRELCTNDDANPSLIERDEGWYIHDYPEHQDTKAEINARRERARAAGQQGGLAKAKRTAKRTASKSLSKTLSKNVAETETETDNSTYVGNPPHVSNTRPRDGRGKALARFDELNRAARSTDAYRIAEAFSASLPVPIEAGLLAGVGTQIDKCLKAGIPPPAIATGLQAWTVSDSWSPTQIPNFVHKANNRVSTSGNGKPTAKALGYDQALAELLTEVQTL
jgi:hypothetical protein